MQERRVYPRFDVILPAKMWVEGEALEGNIFDISMRGLQLGCDHAAVARAVPTSGQIVSPGQNLMVKVSFQVPGEKTAIEVDCRIAVCRRVSDNEYRVGLEIIEFDSESDNYLFESYIQQRLEEVA